MSEFDARMVILSTDLEPVDVAPGSKTSVTHAIWDAVVQRFVM